MKILKYTYLLPIVLVALLSACCAEYYPEANGPGSTNSDGETDVTFNIATSRGALVPGDAANGELIGSYMIVLAQNGNVVKVLKSTGLTPAEMHSVKTRITSGTYKVYAFANIPFANEGDYLYGKFQEGTPLPTAAEMGNLYYGDDSFCNGFKGSVVPMSSKVEGQDLEILASKGNNTYGIEVIRMLAKVEFVFMNSSSEKLTISSISMGPLTTKGTTTAGFVPLFSYSDASALSFATGFATDTYAHDLSSAPITLPAGNVSSQPIASFYVVESNPDPVTKAFNLAFTVKREGGQDAEVRYALLDKTQVINQDGTNLDGDLDKSPFIRRNDWLRIPIDLGDYEFRLAARSYPPIGGYPEVNTDEFKVNFLYHGYFTISPALRKYGTENWISLDDPIITRCEVSVDTESEGLTNIFTTSGSPVKKLNEIVGTIKSGVHGTAAVTLTIDIRISDSLTRTLTRKMYITV